MLPNFILIGAEKTGSTSLYHYLRQHPDVFMCSPKEPNFFSEKGPVHTLEEYEALFEGVKSERAIGEASVGYINSEQACSRIKETLPRVRLLAMLRDPANRAYSHYNMLVRAGAVSGKPYEEVLLAAKRTGNFTNTGIPTSHYASSLKRYFDAFGREQLRIYLYRDFKRDPQLVLRDIFDYLEVDPSFETNITFSYNKTYVPKNNHLHKLLIKKNPARTLAKLILPTFMLGTLKRNLLHINTTPSQSMSPEARALAIEILLDDIRRTEDLLKVDLSAWKQ